MEKISAITVRVLRAPETPAAAKQSIASLPDTEVELLALLMEQTKNSYPQQEIAPETVEMWFPLWMELVAEYGLDSLRLALKAHMRVVGWFPLPSQLRERLDALKRSLDNVFVPNARREVAKLCGAEVAGRMSEMSVEDVSRIYGADSARRYKAKLDAEGRDEGERVG